MRKLILITVLMLASASAFAGDTRSLSLASNDVLQNTPLAQPTVDRTAVNKVAVRLAQAAAPANVQSDAATTLPQTTTTTAAQTPAPAAAPVQTAAPATTTAPTATTTTSTADTPATKPAKTATKTKRESDEHKARRIAAKYGVYW